MKILKTKVQKLETENRLLRSSHASCSTTNDFEKKDFHQKPCNKTGLVNEKCLSSPMNLSHSKGNGKSFKNSKGKIENSRNCRGHAHMYQRKPRNRYGQNQINGNHGTFSPQFSNKIYFKGPNGWFYENKNQSISNKTWIPKTR